MRDSWQKAQWPVVRIRDIGRLHGGGTPSRKRPEFFEGDVPWITGQDIPDDHVAVIDSARDYITEDAIQQSATRKAPAGAVLVTTRVSVGKAAVAGCPICFSQDVTAIIIYSASIALPEYVAHYIRTRRESLLQKNQGSTIAGITRDSLALEPIPLPPLSEQRRIVDILQEAEAVRSLRAQAQTKTSQLIPAIFEEMFFAKKQRKRWKQVSVSDFVASFQGGKSLAGLEGDFEPSKPRVLKISAVTSGYLIPSESKALPTNYEPPAEHYVGPGDLLFSRANTTELVGATALVGRECPTNIVLPDKLWRFVWKKDWEGTPEFVWALFQHPSTRRELGNIATGTGGSMKNIGMKKLMQMRVLWPEKEEQRRFTLLMNEVLELSQQERSEQVAGLLGSSLSAHAFSGELTRDWREANAERLAQEARERDDALKEAGATVTLSRRATMQEEEAIFEQRTDGIYAHLSREQRDLFREIERMVGGVNYIRYFTADTLAKYIDEGPLRRNPKAIEGHLCVLAARGIILPVSREEIAEGTGETVFGNAYRLVRSESHSTLADGDGNILVDEDGSRLVSMEPGDKVRLAELERIGSLLERSDR